MTLFGLIVVALLVARAMASVCVYLGLLDHPDSRKTHDSKVPLSGGIAIFLVIFIGTYAFDIEPYTDAMMLIATLLFIAGFIDDLRHINPWVRLCIEYGAGLLVATLGGIAIQNVGNLLALGPIPLLLLTAPLTALSVAGLCNAYNMIDGIDGLAASLVLLPIAILYVLAVQVGHSSATFLLLMLVPVCVFLLFNLGPGNAWLPRVFLGDSGSITLGFFVTASLVYFSQGNNQLIQPVTALWLVTVPLMDMLATMLRRALHGRKLMEADRLHLHHMLIDLGLSPRRTLLLLVMYAAAAALIGLLLESLPEYLSLALYFLLFFAHCVFVSKSQLIMQHISTMRGART